MELHGGGTTWDGLESDRPSEWGRTGLEGGINAAIGGLRSREFFYPERLGVPDCAYYMRTGSCGYGIKCRYNHPRDRSSFFSRTGTCKFGSSCKFHHPRNSGGFISNVQLNIRGYPVRLGEKECSFYLKTGQCKFGITCKFHHPQLGGMSMPEPAHPFFLTVQSSPVSSHYGGDMTGYRTGRPPQLSGSYMPGAYGPVLFPREFFPFRVGLPTHPQPSSGTASIYGVTQFAGHYPPFPSSAGTSSSGQKERVFPEKPGQPDCLYYMRTGDCKFRSSCRYHHPPDWVVSKTNCVLTPLGLPLRPRVQPCAFYMHNGYCKFGRTSKFNHPIGTVRYSPSASSLTDMPAAPYMISSSLATLAPSS